MQKPAFERRRGQFEIEGSALKLPLKGLCPFGGFGRSPLSIIVRSDTLQLRQLLSDGNHVFICDRHADRTEG